MSYLLELALTSDHRAHYQLVRVGLPPPIQEARDLAIDIAAHFLDIVFGVGCVSSVKGEVINRNRNDHSDHDGSKHWCTRQRVGVFATKQTT